MAAKQKLTRVNWIYDEIVLVADVLSRNNWKYIEPTSEAALQLSTLLRDGILHGDRVNHPSELPDSFRNTSSIALSPPISSPHCLHTKVKERTETVLTLWLPKSSSTMRMQCVSMPPRYERPY